MCSNFCLQDHEMLSDGCILLCKEVKSMGGNWWILERRVDGNSLIPSSLFQKQWLICRFSVLSDLVSYYAMLYIIRFYQAIVFILST